MLGPPTIPVAVSTRSGSELRRPEEASALKENKETAIAYAMYRTCLDQYPAFAEYLTTEMKSMGYDPENTSEDATTAVGIGNISARKVLEYRHS